MTDTSAVEVTKFVKAGGPITKKLHLGADGRLQNDSSDCALSSGQVKRVHLQDWRDFAALIEGAADNVAFALGKLVEHLPEKAHLVLKGDRRAGKPGFIARTGANFAYTPGRPSLILCDYDNKEQPADVKARIDALGGFAGALASICPNVATSGYIRRRSTSANVVNEETGELYPSSGEHLYLFARDGADSQRFLGALHAKAWLCGLGWFWVGRSGQMLDRSIIDRAVAQPERLIFEAAPVLSPPLKQQPRPALIHEGGAIDTRSACPDLTSAEKSELARIKAAAQLGLRHQAEAARAKFIAERIAEAVGRGVDLGRARDAAEAWSRGVLRPAAVLEFDDLGTVTVADVLADPAKYEGETLSDPIEGVAYGRNTAIVRGGGIFSFAHGSASFKLVHDYASIVAAIAAAPVTEAAKVLARMITRADVGHDEAKLLCKRAGERAGTGTRPVEKMVAEALAEQKAQAARDRRAANAVGSPKPRLPAPLHDDEAKPVMLLWDGILANVKAAEPPARDVDGSPTAVRERAIAGLHELSSNGANDEEDPTTRLPAPKTFLLTKHDVHSLEIELSDYMTFVQETEQGEREVGAPHRLLTHWLKYRQSKLPVVRAVLNMPIVLSNGQLLSGEGLNREFGVVFRIDPALLVHIPKREACTHEAVGKAYRYLVDEWLTDVLADPEGKAVLVAYALSIIERILFPERPAFFVTAGLRGNGKTTALIMITLAILGVKPAAMAWTHDPEERKKAIFAVLREGAPALIFDNIPRGTTISCPHIERACTTELYQDRVLGETSTPCAPAFTIFGLTGNNVGPKGDMASRTLTARLNADRVDPENRIFAHDDPIAWTLDHRGEILAALYTILLGNPRSSGATQTRFKTWQRLVGSAIENAVHQMTGGASVSFKAMFARVEADDEDAVSRSDILKTLCGMWPEPASFTTADLAERLRVIAGQVKNGEDEKPEMTELRRFCTASKAYTPSPKSITRALKAIEGAPTVVGATIKTLRVSRDSKTKATTFTIANR
jgi:hypothetical protein